MSKQRRESEEQEEYGKEERRGHSAVVSLQGFS